LHCKGFNPHYRKLNDHCKKGNSLHVWEDGPCKRKAPGF
jgi:hypothetical protein